jgi:transglutaminase-like putative cysteine protease
MRWRADAIYLVTLIATIAGFGLVSRDIVAIASPEKPVSVASPKQPDRNSGWGSVPAPVDVEGWANTLAAYATPGPNVRAFVNAYPGGPAQKIAAVYARIVREWLYDADLERDRFTPAEVLTQPGNLRGDCKQIATLLYSCAVALGVKARIVATAGQNGGPGHVHAEILLCRSEEDPTASIELMKTVWVSVYGRDVVGHPAEPQLSRTAEGVYLILDGGITPSKLQLGPTEAIISSSPNPSQEKIQ